MIVHHLLQKFAIFLPLSVCNRKYKSLYGLDSSPPKCWLNGDFNFALFFFWFGQVGIYKSGFWGTKADNLTIFINSLKTRGEISKPNETNEGPRQMYQTGWNRCLHGSNEIIFIVHFKQIGWICFYFYFRFCFVVNFLCLHPMNNISSKYSFYNQKYAFQLFNTDHLMYFFISHIIINKLKVLLLHL